VRAPETAATLSAPAAEPRAAESRPAERLEARPERPEQPERAERPERIERPERVDRPASEHAERGPEQAEPRSQPHVESRPEAPSKATEPTPAEPAEAAAPRAERPSEPAAAPRAERPSEPAAAPRAERPSESPARTEPVAAQPARAAAPERPERVDRPERVERPERAERPDRAEARPDAQRAERAADAHRPGAPSAASQASAPAAASPPQAAQAGGPPAERTAERPTYRPGRPADRPAGPPSGSGHAPARTERHAERASAEAGRRPGTADVPMTAQGDRPRSRVIVAGPQVVGRGGDVQQAQTVRGHERPSSPPPSTPLPPRVVSPRTTTVEHKRPEPVLDARSQFERELERARARTAEREPRAADEPHAENGEPQPPQPPQPPTRDPSRPAVGSVISLPPRIKITERTPATGRPPPGPQPVNPIRGRFAQQQQQRGGPRGPGGRPGQHNDFGRKKLPLGKKGKQTTITTPAEHKRVIRIEDSITVADLARNMGIKAPEVLKKLWGMGMTGVNINAAIDFDTAQILASEFGYEVQNVAFKEEDVFSQKADDSEQMVHRAPVVTVMGHVDHGKTTLLDSIRKSRVAAGEAGGITQHVAAYKVSAGGHGDIVFLDTPGHEAFTEMRARGAQATDIVVLVVAANDGVMPQTLEALAHAKDAGVKIIVAVNKVDMPDAQPDRVRQQLADHGLIPEEWGGDTIYANVSALKGDGIDNLLAQIAATAEFLELKANPNKQAAGLVIEARLDRNRGPMATLLIQEGTLRVGDILVAGRTFGKVRAMLDDRGNALEEAGPSTPIEVLGLDGVPDAGDQVNAAEDDKVAKQVVEHRRQQERKRELSSKQRFSLENLMERNAEGASKELKVVLKADVQGSAEAIKASLIKLSTEKVRVIVIAAAVGGITETDVHLAQAGGAIIVGFHVRPAGKSSKLAEQEGVEIRLYDIIYDALDDVKAAMAGLLAPIKREVAMGKLNVRETFSIPKIGTVAGCMVIEGKITRKAHLRIIRDAVQVYEGKVASLRRFKDDVSEVQQGYECGVMVAGWNEIKQSDVIEAYEVIEEAAQL